LLARLLKERGIAVDSTDDLDKLVAQAQTIRECFLVIDLDLGPGREDHGLVAIRKLRELERKAKLMLYIVVLTSRSDLQTEASRLKVDAFLSKDASGQSDALELLGHFGEFQEQRNQRWHQGIHRELAARHYGGLNECLKSIPIGLAGPETFSAKLMIEKALARPSLDCSENAGEKAVLSALVEQIRNASQYGWNEHSIQVAREGGNILAQQQFSDERIDAWRRRALAQGIPVIHAWLGERFGEDLDPE
jgi:CheY-like chemotaxis protein